MSRCRALLSLNRGCCIYLFLCKHQPPITDDRGVTGPIIIFRFCFFPPGDVVPYGFASRYLSFRRRQVSFRFLRKLLVFSSANFLRQSVMDAKLLFAVLLSLVGLLCCHGETNESSLIYQRYGNVFDEPVDDAIADMYLRSLNIYNQLRYRFQLMWIKIRNDLNSQHPDENQIQNTFPIQINKETMYPESVSEKVKKNILKRRRRNDNLPTTSSIAPLTPITTDIQSTSVTSISVSQSENTSPMSTISLTYSVPEVQNYSSALTNSTVVPVRQVTSNSSTVATSTNVSESENISPMSTMSSISSVPKVQNYSSASDNSTVVPPVQESSSYDSTSIKFVLENESTIFPLTPSIEIKQGDLNNDHILQNNTNDVKIDKMVDENIKTSTSSDTKEPMFWYILCLFVVITVGLVIGVHRYYMNKTCFRSRRNHAHYEVRRGNCHEDESATQV